MKRIIVSIVTGGLFVSTATAVLADTKIEQRKDNQQGRIAQGVKGGSLTPHETANLEHKETKLNKEIRSDRKANGGNLTNNEKKQVNQQQNHLSNQIYRDKHNGATQK